MVGLSAKRGSLGSCIIASTGLEVAQLIIQLLIQRTFSPGRARLERGETWGDEVISKSIPLRRFALDEFKQNSQYRHLASGVHIIILLMKGPLV